MLTGVIHSFDAIRGDGWLRSESGEEFYFHCVTIADGTRNIDNDVEATGRRTWGHLGRDEVCDVRVAS